MLAASVAGVFTSGYFFAFHVLHIIVHNNLLERVLQSVTKNGSSLLWVAALAAVVIYVFTIFEFAFYRGSFAPNGLLCGTLWECYVTTLDFGTGSKRRNGECQARNSAEMGNVKREATPKWGSGCGQRGACGVKAGSAAPWASKRAPRLGRESERHAWG